MNSVHYIGFDVHKKTISFCVKTAAGEIVEEGSVLAQLVYHVADRDFPSRIWLSPAELRIEQNRIVINEVLQEWG